jgi:alkylhydroperoxidase family enzyme
LGALADPAQSALFSERERAALAYAEAITLANTVSDDIFESVRRHFNNDEIVELTAVITFEICVAKFNRALEIEGHGICAVRPPAKRTSTERGSGFPAK